MTRPPRQMHDFRPLNTVELTPPDYRINPQYLVHSCVELEVKYSGIIPNVLQTVDATNRTDVLRVIDRGKREKYLPTNSQDAIFYLNIHNIKLLTRDGNEELLLRLPVHEVAALSYICEDKSHILAIKYGNGDLSQQASPSIIMDDSVMCSMVVLYCESRRRAEELCSLVDQCFQMIYTEATMRFFDRNLLEGAQSFDAVGPDYLYTDKSRESTPRNGSRNDAPTLGFLSHSSVDLGTSSATTSRSLSRGISHGSDSELSSAANQLILDYMKMLYDKLNAEELQRFALLIKAWQGPPSELSFPEFINNVVDLYGVERNHLLVGMRPFIPAKDLAYFEHFVEHMTVADSQMNTAQSARSFRAAGVGSMYRQSSQATDSVDDFEMWTDMIGSTERF